LPDRVLRELLARYGSARAALSAPAVELGEGAAARGTRPIRERVERGLRLVEREGIEILVESDPRYPVRLLELQDPPPLLFARGGGGLLARPASAIMGPRGPTGYGRDAARVLAGGAARAGLVIVGGMARGMDGEAHPAALAWGTVGVLGCAIDVVY